MSVQLGMLGHTEWVCSLYRPVQGGPRTGKPSDRYVPSVPGGMENLASNQGLTYRSIPVYRYIVGTGIGPVPG
ncbi:hypothetical protein GW17_00038817, partial [Ensete ventricosum]